MSEVLKPFSTFRDVLDFAIQREREARETYLSFAKGTSYQGMRSLLVSMAEQEREHETKLVGLLARGGGESLFSKRRPQDLNLDAYTVAVAFRPQMDYQDFLLLVIQKETASQRLYEQLRDGASEEEVREMFDGLSEEEKRHKGWAQDRYDLEILKQN